jgi:release factor glutamine methyltransferase
MDQTSFCGLTLATLPGLVMIPRRASEGLVNAVVDRVGDRAAVVADVGTGSGAVALAIATFARRSRVWATDTSAVAVRLARANARRHGLADRVSVRRGDLLDPVRGRVDVVVANLPYLPLAEAKLHPDLNSEPEAAVFAAGDGLQHYRRLIAAAQDRLLPDGALVIQLHRRVLVAEHAAIERLATELAAGPVAPCTVPRWTPSASITTSRWRSSRSPASRLRFSRR